MKQIKQSQTRAARKARKAANRKRNEWMPAFAASTINDFQTFNLIKRGLGRG